MKSSKREGYIMMLLLSGLNAVGLLCLLFPHGWRAALAFIGLSTLLFAGWMGYSIYRER